MLVGLLGLEWLLCLEVGLQVPHYLVCLLDDLGVGFELGLGEVALQPEELGFLLGALG